jgi:hypothetical protein
MLKRLLGALLVLSVLMTSFAMVGTASAAVEKEFVVDGNLDIWYLTTEEAEAVNKDDGNYYYFPELQAYYKMGGVAVYMDYETAAQVYTAYDDEYVYMYVKVWDDEIIPYDEATMSDSAHADSLEIWFDPDPESQTHFANGSARPAKGTAASLLNREDYASEAAYKEALRAKIEEIGEVEDSFDNQTNDPDQGDVQVRLLAYDMMRHDYHPIVKPGYFNEFGEPVTFEEWVRNCENFCAFTFENEPIEFENLDGTTHEVASGYGVEARFPRNSGYNSINYQFNIAVNNSYPGEDQYSHYALAINSAWWSVFDNCNVVFYAEKTNPFFAQTVGNQQIQYTDSEVNMNGPAGAVVESIAALPAEIYLEDEAAIREATDAYDALTEIEKGYVQYKNYDVLVAAQERLVELGGGGGSNPIIKPLYGDVNGDKTVNAVDSLLALQAAVKKITLTETQFKYADVDGNGAVNSVDALTILQRAIEQISKFPVEK